VIESVDRTDALKTAGNQAVYNLVITETIVEERVTSVQQVSTNIDTNVDKLAELNGKILSVSAYDVTDPLNLSQATSRLSNSLNNYKKAFDNVLSKADDLRTQFESAVTSIEQSIDTLIQSPKDLFSAISQLAKIPSKAFVSIKAKVEGYANLIATFIGDTNVITGTDQNAKNQRIEVQGHTNALFGGLASSYTYAAENSAASESTSTVDNAVIDIASTGVGFVTRSEAIQNAVSIIESYVETQEFLDNEQQTSEDSSLQARFSVSPDTTQLLTEIIKQTAGNLINLSFRLKQERKIILQNDSTFINLCFELYGSTKLNVIDFFLATNTLSEDEFLLVPRGTEIRYYA
jgi:hypothetical protein